MVIIFGVLSSIYVYKPVYEQLEQKQREKKFKKTSEFDE